MTFTTFDAVLYTIGFLVPGFIWSATLAMLVPIREPPQHVGLLNYLTLSAINHGLWSWALFPMFSTTFVKDHPAWSGLILFIEGFVSPVCLGLFTARLQQRRSIARFLQRVGFRTIDRTPTAWDWQFRREKPYWILVTLKNGSRIYGLFSSESFAGDDPDNHDIYIEKVYRQIGDEEYNEWAPVEDSAGALISASEISVIEFRKVEDFDYDR